MSTFDLSQLGKINGTTDVYAYVAVAQGILNSYIQPFANIIAAAGTVWIGYSARLHAIMAAEEEACRRARQQLQDESSHFDPKWAKLLFKSKIMLDGDKQTNLEDRDFEEAFSGVNTHNPVAANILVQLDEFLDRLVTCSRVFENVKGNPIVKIAKERAKLLREKNPATAQISGAIAQFRTILLKILTSPLILVGQFYSPAASLSDRIVETVDSSMSSVGKYISSTIDRISDKLFGAVDDSNIMDPRIHTGEYDSITSNLRQCCIHFAMFYHDDEEPSKKRKYIKNKFGGELDFKRVAGMMDVFIPPELSLIEQEENLAVKIVTFNDI